MDAVVTAVETSFLTACCLGGSWMSVKLDENKILDDGSAANDAEGDFGGRTWLLSDEGRVIFNVDSGAEALREFPKLGGSSPVSLM